MNYQAIYDRLIDRARGRILVGYSERHHVIPRCLKGTDAAVNLVTLTAEEHFVAHLLLVKLHPDNLGILSAAHIMASSGNTPRPNNKIYGWLRRRMAILQTGQKRPPQVGAKIGARLKDRKRDPQAVAKGAAKLKGLVRSPEARANIAAGRLGIVFSPSHLANMSACQVGKKASAATKAKMSATRTGRPRPPTSDATRLKMKASRLAYVVLRGI